MQKNHYPKVIRLAAGVSLLLGINLTAGTGSLRGSRPNVILVMTDDQGYGDLGCHGHPYLKTPNLDRLHGQSTRFTDFHVSPTCAPTRAALMSDRAPFKKAFTEYAMLCKDHYWKENDILYPMAARVMSAEDARAVQDGILAVEAALGPDTHARYYALADKLVTGVVQDLSLGLDREVLACILNMLPVELSFVDADDTVQYFSHEDHDKIFPRNRSAIGTKVQDCHPPTSVHLVNKILREFKAGSRQVAEFWIEMGPKFVHIRYFPVRDKNGAYLGTLEVVQDAAPIRALEGQRRILAEE